MLCIDAPRAKVLLPVRANGLSLGGKGRSEFEGDCGLHGKGYCAICLKDRLEFSQLVEANRVSLEIAPQTAQNARLQQMLSRLLLSRLC